MWNVEKLHNVTLSTTVTNSTETASNSRAVPVTAVKPRWTSVSRGRETMCQLVVRSDSHCHAAVECQGWLCRLSLINCRCQTRHLHTTPEIMTNSQTRAMREMTHPLHSVMTSFTTSTMQQITYTQSSFFQRIAKPTPNRRTTTSDWLCCHAVLYNVPCCVYLPSLTSTAHIAGTFT